MGIILLVCISKFPGLIERKRKAKMCPKIVLPKPQYGSLEEKTKQFIAYITQRFRSASITTLMKLAYLSDLVSVKRTDHQISTFQYKRYKYGPFDSRIYGYIESLLNDKILEDYTVTSAPSEEIVVYALTESGEKIPFNKLSAKDKSITDEVVNNLSGYGAKTITEIAYKTKPMLALGATLGGAEHLNEPLDLNAE